MAEMLESVKHRRLEFSIERLDKTFYYPLKSNCQVDDSDGERSYERVDKLSWSES